MRIELEPPYSELYEFGTKTIGADGRCRVTLWGTKNGKRIRRGTAYARYLMAVKEGRFLNPDEIVDHKDEDRTNDHIDNLQILTNVENVKKHHEFKLAVLEANGEAVWLILQCPYCATVFRKRQKVVIAGEKKGVVFTCSRECARKVPPRPGSKTGGVKSKVLPDETVARIKELDALGWSSYRIAAELQIARNQVMKRTRK